MRKLWISCCILVLCAFILVSSPPARASTIVQTWTQWTSDLGPTLASLNWPNHSTHWSANHDFNQFDPSLGTLNNVYVSLQVGLMSNGVNSIPPVFGGWTYEPNVDVTAHSAAASTDINAQTAYQQTYFRPPSMILANSDPVVKNLFLPWELPAWQGSGLVNYALDVEASFFTTSGNVHPEIFMGWNIMTVTYEYDPVPIPGAVWLLGSGLAGLIGVRRFGRG